MVKFVFDPRKRAFVQKRATVRSVLWAIVRYTGAILFSALIFYAVFALVFSTDRERMLEREHQLLAQERAALALELGIVEESVEYLQVRDREIYQELFGSDPPNYIIEAQDTLIRDLSEMEAMSESDLIWDAYVQTSRVESTVSQVSRWLTEIDTLLSGGSIRPSAIPSVIPVRPFSPLQTGASLGKKINPFYKTIRDHDGLDLVVPAGTEVRCSAEGKVVEVVRSEKGMGNRVTVDHGDGIQTFYAHLNQVKVSQGQTVRQGELIGTVGQSGSCFAPCLHYEVRRNGFLQDPVNYFFAVLDPATYREMMTVALTTGQSMD